MGALALDSDMAVFMDWLRGAASKLRPAPLLVRFRENNSGGEWRLTDGQWSALEKAGWFVERPGFEPEYGKDGMRKLGADGFPAMKQGKPGSAERSRVAWRRGLPEELAKLDWEQAVGLDSAEPGCRCCGPPFVFSLEDEGRLY